MMQGLVLDAAEPLYGRADTIMRLAPIKVRFLQEVLHTDAVSTIEEYAIGGGVPRYWELRERERSMMEAVKYHVLDVNGTLYEKPVRLFMDDMSQTTMSSTLLSLIGNGVNRLSEIAGSKSFTHRLGQVGDGMQDDRGQFVGARWKILCRHAVSGNLIDGTVWNVASRWWGSVSRDKSVELDVVAESQDKKKVLIGECKWTEGEYAERLLENLKERSRLCPFIKGREVTYVLFLKRPAMDGVTQNVFLPQDVINDCF